MATKIKNLGRERVQVGVITADGKKASIGLQPRSPKPVELPEGVTLDLNWMALYGQKVKIMPDLPAVKIPEVQAAAVPAVVETATPAPDTTA